MPITINGSGTITGISAGGLPDGIITAADIASGQVFSLNGVQFPASQVASADANTLDDYEEGTWTPTIIGMTTTGTGTYTNQNGRYTKVGNLVTFSALVVWTAHTGTGTMRIANLPFTVLNALPEPAVTTIWVNITFTNIPVANMVINDTQIYLATMASNASTSALSMDTAGTMIVSGSYYTS